MAGQILPPPIALLRLCVAFWGSPEVAGVPTLCTHKISRGWHLYPQVRHTETLTGESCNNKIPCPLGKFENACVTFILLSVQFSDFLFRRTCILRKQPH